MSTIPPLFKKCATCREFFPAKLGDIHDRCPKHAADFSHTFYDIQRTRSLSPVLYDVYWKDEESNPYIVPYHRACRGCGKPLLRKNGKPLSNAAPKRWCSETCVKLTPFHIWGEIALQFLNSSSVKRRKALNQQYHYRGIEFQCQGCGEWVFTVDVHHVKPVSLLEESEMSLIWDYSNLQVLCKKCHGGAHESIVEARRQAKQDEIKKKWRVLI